MHVRAESGARDAFVFVVAAILTLSPSDGSKNLRSALLFPTRPSRFKFQNNFNDEHRGPKAISPLQVSTPTRQSSPPDGHPSSSIEKRRALLPISREDLSTQ